MLASVTEPPQLPARTAVLADRPGWLEPIARLAERAGVVVAGRAAAVEPAMALVRCEQPVLLVTALHLPGGMPGGIELMRRARSARPGLRALVLSSSAEPKDVDAAFDAGACAYVLRTAPPEDLVAAFRMAIADAVFVAGTPAAGSVRSGERAARLTRREREILALVSEGHSNAELARMLWVTEQTVKFHLSNIYRKLEVSNRTEASRWAQRAGLLASASPARAAA